MNVLVNIPGLLRVKQWAKNAFILFPLLFAGRIGATELLKDCLATLIGFCLISSSVYIANDIIDAKSDRLHPKKSKRPLAHGDIKIPTAITISLVCMLAGLLITINIDRFIFFTAITYICLHLLYNLFAKHIVIIDVIFVAFGFQIRIWAGAIAAQVLPSVWLQMCVFLLALFLGFTKRRYEISTLRDKASEHRTVLTHYTSYLLDQIIIICSTLSIVFYGLYTVSPEITARIGSYHMTYSLAFVIYGIFRYLYLVHVKKMGDDPGEVIFSDIPLMVNITLWVIYVIWILYPRTVLL